eukprot:gene4822-6010_t
MRYDISNDSLDLKYSELNEPRYYSSVCFDGERYIYLWCGHGPSKPINNIERFDIINKKSEIILEIPDYEISTWEACIIIHENQLYFSNGLQFYRYNLQNEQLSKFESTTEFTTIYYYQPKNQFIAISLDVNKGITNVYIEDLSTFDITSQNTQDKTLFKLEYSFNISISKFHPSIIFDDVNI